MLRYLNIFITVFVSAGILTCLPASGMEDSEYENRMHSLYLKYYKNPVSYGDWMTAINNLSSSSHTLKHKDTLWDLSKDKLKQSLYWSKLWVANKHIKNPHRILKGDSISWELEKLKEVSDSGSSLDILSQFKNIKIPELVRKPILTEENMPDSLAYLQKPILTKKNIHLEFSEDKKSNLIGILSTYVSDDKIPSVGTVVRKNGLGSFSFNGEQVILDINGNIPNSGDVYTLFQNKRSFGFFGINGHEIVIKGEAKIVGPVLGSDSMYIAEVTKSMDMIQPGDLISLGPVPHYSIPYKTKVGDERGRIIGFSQFQNESASINSLIYLNKGKSDGVYPGNLYYVRADKESHKDAKIPYSESATGLIQIIHSSSSMSTATIIEMRSYILKGDFFSGSVFGSVLRDAEIINPENISDEDLDEKTLEEGDFIDKQELELDESFEIEKDSDEVNSVTEDQELQNDEDFERIEEDEGSDEEDMEVIDVELDNEEEELELGETDSAARDQEVLEEGIQEEFEKFESMEEIEDSDDF